MIAEGAVDMRINPQVTEFRRIRDTYSIKTFYLWDKALQARHPDVNYKQERDRDDHQWNFLAHEWLGKMVCIDIYKKN
jgi:hypothetical protein